MPSKHDIISSLAKEAAIIAHLAGKLRPEHLAFRFTPGQRSTQELLEYLAVTGEGAVSFHLTGSWEVWEQREAEVAGLTLERLPTVLEAQQRAIEALLAHVSDDDFATRRTKNGQGVELPLAEALFEGIVKQVVGYKTQLFLQAKAAGVAHLASSNLWRGEDAKAKAH